MNAPTPIRNTYCDCPEDLVVPHRCACCVRCWLYVAGRKTGMCPWGGPFAGFEKSGFSASAACAAPSGEVSRAEGASG